MRSQFLECKATWLHRQCSVLAYDSPDEADYQRDTEGQPDGAEEENECIAGGFIVSFQSQQRVFLVVRFRQRAGVSTSVHFVIIGGVGLAEASDKLLLGWEDVPSLALAPFSAFRLAPIRGLTIQIIRKILH